MGIEGGDGERGLLFQAASAEAGLCGGDAGERNETQLAPSLVND